MGRNTKKTLRVASKPKKDDQPEPPRVATCRNSNSGGQIEGKKSTSKKVDKPGRQLATKRKSEVIGQEETKNSPIKQKKDTRQKSESIEEEETKSQKKTSKKNLD